MNEPGDGTESGRSLRFSDAIIVTAVTGLAYCITFAAAYGSARYYGVPFDMVTVSAPQVIALSCTLIVLGGYSVANLIHSRIPIQIADAWPTRFATLIVCVLLLIGSLAYVSRGVTLKSVLITALVAAAAAGNVMLLSLFTRAVEQRFGAPAAFYAICITMGAIGIAHLAGFVHARDREWYRIIQDGRYKGYAIVWHVSDELVIVQKCDRKGRRLVENVAMMKIDKDNALTWSYVRAGPLDDVYSTWHRQN